MKGYWTLLGMLAGGLAKGWKGAILGTGLGWGLGTFLERAPDRREMAFSEVRGMEPGHPEDGIIEAMLEAEAVPAEEARVETFYQDVVGSHPAGLAAAEVKETRRQESSEK
jgi:hypothetical protein